MMRKLRFLTVLAAVLLPVTAGAVLQDKDFVEARKEAMHHLQVRIMKMAVPHATPADCHLWAKVVGKVFKGRTRFLTRGTEIEIDVSCRRRNDLIPTGDTLWMDVADLEDAIYLEIYINSRKQGNIRVFDIPYWQSMIVEKPTRNPECPDSEDGKSCR